MNNLKRSFAFLLTLTTASFGCSKPLDEDIAVSLNKVEALSATAMSVVKYINVNLYGGSNAYKDAAWNDWNTAASLSSAKLKYSDGTTSAISLKLSAQSGVADNGTSYKPTMAPVPVMRYASYGTATRTLTIQGLNSQSKYSLELYASRSGATKNTTRYTIGTKNIDILTDNNYTKKASFTGLTPSSGEIKVTIAKLKDFNYLNALTLTEEGDFSVDTTKPAADTVVTVKDTVVVPVAKGCNSSAGRVYTQKATSGNEIYVPDAASRGWKGGDTVRIPAGNYSLIHIANFNGDSCRPLVFINYGGQVKATQVRLSNAAYFKFVGTGHTGTTYGFKFTSTANAGMSIASAHHVEVSNIEVTGAEVGFYFKKAPSSSDPTSVYPAYVMSNFYIHHNYIHDVHGEGMYIGHTYPNADPYNGNLIPVRMDKVEIAYNTVDGTDWDGIQLSNARSGASIHHNTVKNFGRINKGGQQAGIILGGNTTGNVYNNTVSTGTGNGIEAFGYGTIKIYNNTVENVGKDGTVKGQDAIFCNDPKTNVETNPKQQMFIYDNIVKNPMLKGAIKVSADNKNSLAAQIKNNKLYVAGAPSNWLAVYIISYVTGTVISGNTMN